MIVEEVSAYEKACCAMGVESNCVGSRCMAWRWEAVRNPDYMPQHAMQYPPVMPWDNPMTIASTTHGYCGLAGRP